MRHHRLIETFLYEVLDYPIEEVHEEAERLEHFISERFEQRIAAKLGYPKIDPHGHCIPAMSGRMPKQRSMLLTEAALKTNVVVESVSDRDAGVEMRVQERMPDSRCRVVVGHSSRVLDLPEHVAHSIRVRPLDK